MGSNHDENQDAWCVIGHRARDRGVLFILADGVSITPEGRWAADETCRKLREVYNAETPLCRAGFLESICSIDEIIRARGRGRAACTLSLCWITRTSCQMYKVGDSPVCHVRNGEGVFVAPASDSLYLKNYIGMGPDISNSIEVRDLELQPNDWLLLSSDGVGDVFSAEELGQVCQNLDADLSVIAQSIVSNAHERGSKDDATVVLLNYKDRPSSRLAFEAFFILG